MCELLLLLDALPDDEILVDDAVPVGEVLSELLVLITVGFVLL